MTPPGTSTISERNAVVLYSPGALNPVDDNWINADIDPLPIGVVYGTMTSSAVDTRIFHRINLFLKETYGGGEESQISRNDGLLRSIMCVAGINEFVRNKISTTTPGRRPDFTALYGGVPVLIAEEKDEDNIQGAIDDVINKFDWIPNLRELPFFICFAFSFTQVKIVKLVKNAPHTILLSASLTSLEDRLTVLKPAMNVARVLKHFIDVDMIHHAGLAMGKWHKRNCGKEIRLSSRGVEVKCNGQKFKFFKKLYQACVNVSFLEKLTTVDTMQCILYLGPLGLSRQPRTLNELKRAMLCISTAVFGIHQCGYVHTDIRWSNIVQVDDGWVLIDCYDACELTDCDGLRQRAVDRSITDHSWNSSDDLRQLATICNECSLVSDFKNIFSALIISPRTTLEEVVTACSPSN